MSKILFSHRRRIVGLPVVYIVVLAISLAIAFDAREPAVAQDGAPTVLITGANRGIGLFFARGYADDGWNVIATCREPSKADELKELASDNANVVIEELDITDFDELEGLAEKYRETPIDVLLNNAAINPYRSPPMARFGSMDYDHFRQMMDVNVVAPMKVSEAFLDHIAASKQKKIVVMTSTGGSIANAHINAAAIGVPDYRASKAALNMIMRLFAIDVAERGVIIGIIGPGSVDTLGRLEADPATLPPRVRERLESSRETLLPARETIEQMITLIDGLTSDTSGKFYNWAGEELPW